MDKCRRAVRLLELRAQITVGVLQHSNTAGFDEAGWLHTMLRPFLQLFVGVPTVAALSHLVELMDRRESNKESGVYTSERSPKRQRISYAATDQDESLDDSSSNMSDLLRAGKQSAKNGAPLAPDISDDYPLWYDIQPVLLICLFPCHMLNIISHASSLRLAITLFQDSVGRFYSLVNFRIAAAFSGSRCKPSSSSECS